jgi:hypothetical protein
MDFQKPVRQGITASFHFVDGRDQTKIARLDNGDWSMRPFEPSDANRWPSQWAAYQSVRPKTADTGTPLSEIPGMSSADSMALSLKGIYNVEALAGLDENTAHNVDPLRGLTWRGTAKLVMAAKATSVKEPLSLQKKAA